MKGIMFNEKYGLESAVPNGTKTRTWRADKKPRYEVGEVVAVKQCYRDVINYLRVNKYREYIFYSGIVSIRQAGWNNKMFVRNEFMPHRIRITAIKKCRLQDLTDDEALVRVRKKLQRAKDKYNDALKALELKVEEYKLNN